MDSIRTGASADAIAAFTHSSFRLGATTVDAGVRFGRYAVDASDQSFGASRVQPRALVGSVAASHHVGSGVSVFGSVAQAFRAPNIDDLSTLGAFDFGVEVPSPAREPERSIAIEGGLRMNASDASASLVMFRTDLSDLIDRVRGSFNGSEFYEGQRVYRRANVAEAYVRGVEMEMRWAVAAHVEVCGHLAYAHGQQTTTDQPLRRIPPLNGLVGARFGRGSSRWIEGTVRFAAMQDRLAPGDRDDHRIPLGGTLGWAVVDAAAGWPLGGLQLVGGIHNLFDEAYRVHGSGIDGYGRALWVGARVGF